MPKSTYAILQSIFECNIIKKPYKYPFPYFPMKNKRAQVEVLLNPKTMSFAIGGALIGYFFFQNIQATIIGGIIGIILSFIK